MKWKSRMLVSVCAALGLVACRSGPGSDQHDLAALSQPCATALAPHQGTGQVDPEIARAQQAARSAVDPVAALNHLGQRFVTRARTSQMPAYYAMAEQTALCVEATSPGNAQALLLRGHVLHQLHRFKEAEALARQLVERRGLFLDYGLLGDALLEQGRLDEAGAAYQKMIDRRPHYQAYTRAAHFRWLKGDLTGALQLIQLAVKAASPRDAESVAWAYSRLAAYELQAGRAVESLGASEAALQHQPDYPAALLVRGRALLSGGRAREAVDPLRRAALANPLPEYEWVLADALRAAGDHEGARQVEERLHQSGAEADPRTFALYLATRRERIDDAVALAQKELRSRADVFTFDAVAWSMAAAGRTSEATEAMNRALAAGTKDARLFFHAGVIASARGARAEAVRWLREALSMQQMLFPSEREHLTGELKALKQRA